MNDFFKGLQDAIKDAKKNVLNLDGQLTLEQFNQMIRSMETPDEVYFWYSGEAYMRNKYGNFFKQNEEGEFIKCECPIKL